MLNIWYVHNVVASTAASRRNSVDHMHMTSQKGAQLRWGSNETLPRASSPIHAARGANPASHTAGLARCPRTERLSANAHCQHNTCALRDTRLASLLWRCDPLWRQCIRSIGTGYQIGLMWSSPLTQGIKIGLRLSQDRVPIVFYDRPPIQAEAMTFFFFFLLVKLSIPNQTGYIRGVQWLQQGMHLNVFST